MNLKCRLFGHKYISTVISTPPFDWENKYCKRCKNWRSNFPPDWRDGLISDLIIKMKDIRSTFTGLFYIRNGHRKKNQANAEEYSKLIEFIIDATGGLPVDQFKRIKMEVRK